MCIFNRVFFVSVQGKINVLVIFAAF